MMPFGAATLRIPAMLLASALLVGASNGQPEQAAKPKLRLGARLLFAIDAEAAKKALANNGIAENSRLVRGKQNSLVIAFRGCTPGSDGRCDVRAGVVIYSPAGQQWAKFDDLRVGQSPLKAGPDRGPQRTWLFWRNAIGLSLDPGDRAGTYRVEVNFEDRVSGKKLQTRLRIVAVEPCSSTKGKKPCG